MTQYFLIIFSVYPRCFLNFFSVFSQCFLNSMFSQFFPTFSQSFLSLFSFFLNFFSVFSQIFSVFNQQILSFCGFTHSDCVQSFLSLNSIIFTHFFSFLLSLCIESSFTVAGVTNYLKYPCTVQSMLYMSRYFKYCMFPRWFS